MQLSVEISKYPLAEDYEPHILQFIKRLNEHPGIKVMTNTMSTQVFGEYQAVMTAINQSMEASFETGQKAVLVMKFINSNLDPEAAG